jgi:hypothetical protein
MRKKRHPFDKELFTLLIGEYKTKLDFSVNYANLDKLCQSINGKTLDELERRVKNKKIIGTSRSIDRDQVSKYSLIRHFGLIENKTQNGEEAKISFSALDLYARKVDNGYLNWDDFCEKAKQKYDAAKAFNQLDYFHFSSLCENEIICIGWYPHKYCRLKKIQENILEDDSINDLDGLLDKNLEDLDYNSFEVIESFGMKSKVGRKFATSGFRLAPAPNKATYPEVIILPLYEYQAELWEYYDNIEKSGKFDIQTCPPELLL